MGCSVKLSNRKCALLAMLCCCLVSDDTYQMGEQTDFGPDIVADYENRKKLEPLDLK